MRLLIALALLLPALPLAAQVFPSCVVRTKRGWMDPKSLSKLMTCQEYERRRFISLYIEKHKSSPSPELLDRLDDHQRAEVRAYLRRHPDRASLSDGKEDEDEAAEPAEQAARRNLRRLEPDQRKAYQELERKLKRKSMGGQLGVTPDMAKDIMEFLKLQQGGMSADMSDLLGAVSKDGPNLTHGTMRKLKRASRSAASEGLDLGVDPKLERWLLDPRTDPDADETGPSMN